MVRTLVVDNGSFTIKAGFTTSENPMIVQNAVIKAASVKNRVFTGPEFDKVKDRVLLNFTDPFENGYITHWDTQKSVWDVLFNEDYLKVDPKDTRLLLTDPLNVLPVMKEHATEILFELMGFEGVMKIGAPVCAGIPQDVDFEKPYLCLVVDSGHSFTHFVPMLNGKIMQGYVKQLRIGGKHLTEKLKEWISYRHVIVQNDMWLVNECKEKACFVSQNFTQDERTISARNNSISCDYSLPDCYDLYEGVVHEPNSNTKSKYIYAQSFKMGMERIATPEILFRPSDIGVKSMGIAEGVWNTIRSLPERYWGRILQNIILVGGNTKFPGFKQRLINDLRPIVPQLYSIQVTQPENPDTYIWHCAKRVAEVEDEFGFVTRKEYLDRGLANCRQRFDRNMQV